ncbi:MAG: leucyl aminopeptidase [Bacteroidales bacterium]|jgi:leucyl aminopeptidase|nr:leucyl aminopeptidase [Bacteroidales bacterium]
MIKTCINISDKLLPDQNIITIIDKDSDLERVSLSKTELEYLKSSIDKRETLIEINSYFKYSFFIVLDNKKDQNKIFEFLRTKGSDISSRINTLKIDDIGISNLSANPEFSIPLAEGIILSQYAFTKYLSDKEGKTPHLKEIIIHCDLITSKAVEELGKLCESVNWARDLVNEPVNNLNAEELAKRVVEQGEISGYTTTVLTKKKIESLKMGGLLAVNKGSIDPPTFSVLEYKHPDHKNKKPIVLVGKGVTYDTGGLSLKTSKQMDTMKCDMGGAATVVATIDAIAKNQLPVHVIALVPATDNRPDGNAYVPGDVITMHSGSTVEVLNTDAEGRLILADALSYSEKYDPELVINVATLTGSAYAAIGPKGIVAMGNAPKPIFLRLEDCGYNVHERVALFPFWDDYKDLLKSDIADLKNLGGDYGGAITAGKFLEHFVKAPFIHLDIAGVAFIGAKDSYRTAGGTGTGVRLLYNFIKHY